METFLIPVHNVGGQDGLGELDTRAAANVSKGTLLRLEIADVEALLRPEPFKTEPVDRLFLFHQESVGREARPAATAGPAHSGVEALEVDSVVSAVAAAADSAAVVQPEAGSWCPSRNGIFRPPAAFSLVFNPRNSALCLRLKTRSGLAGNQNLPFLDGH